MENRNVFIHLFFVKAFMQSCLKKVIEELITHSWFYLLFFLDELSAAGGPKQTNLHRDKNWFLITVVQFKINIIKPFFFFLFFFSYNNPEIEIKKNNRLADWLTDWLTDWWRKDSTRLPPSVRTRDGEVELWTCCSRFTFCYSRLLVEGVCIQMASTVLRL